MMLTSLLAVSLPTSLPPHQSSQKNRLGKPNLLGDITESVPPTPPPVSLRLIGCQLFPAFHQLPVQNEPLQVFPLILCGPSGAPYGLQHSCRTRVSYTPQPFAIRIAGHSFRGSPPPPPYIRSRTSDPPLTRRLQTRWRPAPPSPFLRLFNPILSTNCDLSCSIH